MVSTHDVPATVLRVRYSFTNSPLPRYVISYRVAQDPTIKRFEQLRLARTLDLTTYPGGVYCIFPFTHIRWGLGDDMLAVFSLWGNSEDPGAILNFSGKHG